MLTVTPVRTIEETARLGEQLLLQQIQPILSNEDDGKFVAIDVDSSQFEVDSDDYIAVQRLKARFPAADIWLGRAGSRTTCRIGPRR